MKMTKIKICGIKNSEELRISNKYRPDYIGFVFAAGSRRQLKPSQAAELGEKLMPGIKKVGVFVDSDAFHTADIAAQTGLDAVQLHGNEDGRYIKLLRSLIKPGTEIWKALRIGAGHLPQPCLPGEMEIDRLLLDTYVAGIPGGTGRSFDWEVVPQLDTGIPVVLAGGLCPGNVSEAIKQALPYAVDTSSGVEHEGKKDENKIRAFIKAVRGRNI